MNKNQYLSLAELVNLFVFLLENNAGLYIYRRNKRKQYITEHDVYMFGWKSF